VTLTRTKNTNRLATLFNTAFTSYESIDLDRAGHYKTIFDKGSGNGQHYTQPGTNFGEWVLIPEQTFTGEVKMWGAGVDLVVVETADTMLAVVVECLQYFITLMD